MLAEVVVCAGAGVVAGGWGGGATVEVLGAGAGAVLFTGAGAGFWPPLLAAEVTPAEPGLVADADAAALALPEACGDPDAGADAESEAEDWLVPEPAAGWPVEEVLAALTGAERAKSVTRATTVRALSWVVRQVSLPSRRRPSSRPPSTDSSWRICVNRSFRDISQVVAGRHPA